MNLVFEPKAGLLAWAAQRIPGMRPEDFGPCETFGFADRKLAAVAVFNNFRAFDAQLTFVSDDPRWATRGNIRAVFWYAFEQLKLRRLTCITAKGNKRARKLCEGMGFRREGTHPRGVDGRKTAISYGLLPEHCKWLRVPHVEKESIAATGS
ncbi:MAG: GNAT family N-acetyltransferase [Gemmatimonadaceae bacterium]|nr:GNAT family N-acetyltransferase [Gemmatimonadaceae bacterium]